MKILLLCSIFLINILFADYNSDTQNKGKIDMHGGKSEMLINNKNSLSNTNFNNLNTIGINKPLAPKAPVMLIKEEKKKEEKKENTK